MAHRQKINPMAFPNRLVIFTRCPTPGITKAAPIPKLAPDGLADIQHDMTELTLKYAWYLRLARSIDIQVFFESGDVDTMKKLFGTDFTFEPQPTGFLGERLSRAFTSAFREKMEKVVIIGSDCPELNCEILKQAFDALGRSDVVIGPAKDGGYYLIGLRKSTPALFENIGWGTDRVLQQTMDKADKLSLSIHLLQELSDMGRPEDIQIVMPVRDDALLPLISVIIPTLNEANTIEASIKAAKDNDNNEIIVVDGGSEDNTIEISESLGANIIKTSRCRGKQLNVGAKAARGDILLFIHADTILPKGYSDAVYETLLKPGCIAGAFKLKIAGRPRCLKAIEFLANWRSKHMELPYANQGIFIRSDFFDRIGGFLSIPIMEDYDLMNRIRGLGKIEITKIPAIVSGKRWEELGILKTMLINQVVIAGYKMGADPIRLARWHKRERR